MEDRKRGSAPKGPENQNDIIDYCSQCEMAFLELYNTYCIGAKDAKIPDIIDSFWIDIYNKVLKPDRNIINNQKSKLIYSDLETMENITRLYVNLCRRFGGVVKINAFSEFTGISREALNIWHNAKHIKPYIVTLNTKEQKEEQDNIIYLDSQTIEQYNYNIYNNSIHYQKIPENIKQLAFYRIDCKKILVESMQGSTRNGLSNSPVGHLARANNDEELAMMWDAKRQITSATLNGKTTLTASELPKLGNINNAGSATIPEIENNENIIDL